MKSIKIRNRWTGSVVFEYTKERNTIAEAVLEAIRCDANLRNADLRNADLSGANLPTKIITVGPIGSRQSYTIYRVDENIVQCGCWHGEGREPWKGGTLEEFEERVIAAYPLDTQHGKDYRAVVEYFKTLKMEVGSHE